MILFDSKLPLQDYVTIEDVHTLCAQWISESAFHGMTIPCYQEAKNREFSNGKGSCLKLTEFLSEKTNIFSYRLTQTKKSGEQWIVDILFHPEAAPKYVQIQLSCRRTDGKHPVNVHPPKILSLFLESELCGTDSGGIPLSSDPFRAEDYMEWCSEVMTGTRSTLLPLIYISCDMESNTAINPRSLAKALYGTAHIFAETSHNTAWMMKSYTCGRNPYNQHIGIYFSNPHAYHILAPDDGIISSQYVKAILRRFYSDRSVTKWDYLYLNQLRDSSTLRALCDSVEEDLKYMEQALRSLEAENQTLKANLKQKNAGRPFYHSGTETDLYEGERSDLLFHALTEARKTCQENSRKAHLIDDLLHASPKIGTCEHLEEDLERVFHSGKNINERAVTALKRLGFSLLNDDGHYKFLFHEDPRYLITVSKTGSDHRDSDNILSEIYKLIGIT